VSSGTEDWRRAHQAFVDGMGFIKKHGNVLSWRLNPGPGNEMDAAKGLGADAGWLARVAEEEAALE
jgi:hypothetical protein